MYIYFGRLEKGETMWAIGRENLLQSSGRIGVIYCDSARLSSINKRSIDCRRHQSPFHLRLWCHRHGKRRQTSDSHLKLVNNPLPGTSYIFTPDSSQDAAWHIGLLKVCHVPAKVVTLWARSSNLYRSGSHVFESNTIKCLGDPEAPTSQHVWSRAVALPMCLEI